MPSGASDGRRMEGIETPSREDGGGDYQLSAQMRMVVVIGKLSKEPQSKYGCGEPPALLCCLTQKAGDRLAVKDTKLRCRVRRERVGRVTKWTKKRRGCSGKGRSNPGESGFRYGSGRPSTVRRPGGSRTSRLPRRAGRCRRRALPATSACSPLSPTHDGRFRRISRHRS